MTTLANALRDAALKHGGFRLCVTPAAIRKPELVWNSIADSVREALQFNPAYPDSPRLATNVQQRQVCSWFRSTDAEPYIPHTLVWPVLRDAYFAWEQSCGECA